MQKIEIIRIKFVSFIKLIEVISLSMGIVFGVLMFVIGIFGGDVNANLGTTVLHGRLAGSVSLFLAPAIFLIFGLIVSIIAFLPFKGMMMLIKRVSIMGEFKIATNIYEIQEEKSNENISNNLSDDIEHKED